ncbi:kinase-like domain-containing protein, partial [Lactifluus subvellereus]
ELHAMVLEHLGPSLKERFNNRGHKFSLITVALIAGQLGSHLQNIYTRYYIQCDIKPANILTGLGDAAYIVYLADFGIAKRFHNPNTHAHVPLSNGQHLVGCLAFTSINSHLGIELSRRDDLESLAYVLVYLLRGRFHRLVRVVRTWSFISSADICRFWPSEVLQVHPGIPTRTCFHRQTRLHFSPFIHPRHAPEDMQAQAD